MEPSDQTHVTEACIAPKVGRRLLRPIGVLLITCDACGATNRVPTEKLTRDITAVCGRCKSPLTGTDESQISLVLRLITDIIRVIFAAIRDFVGGIASLIADIVAGAAARLLPLFWIAIVMVGLAYAAVKFIKWAWVN